MSSGWVFASGGAVAGHLPGLTTGGAASAGSIGETFNVTVVSPGVSLTTATPLDIGGAITPGGGIYQMECVANFILTAATVTEFRCGGSTNTNTLPTQTGAPNCYTGENLAIQLANFVLASGTYQLRALSTIIGGSFASGLWAVAQCTFSAGTVSVYGTISCRRVG